MITIEYAPSGDLEHCKVGILVVENVHGSSSDALLNEKRTVELEIRTAYQSMSRGEIKRIHPMDAYVEYYRKFGYSYHVLQQLESVVKGREIPGVIPLVTAMFMAELKNMILTVGHDLSNWNSHSK